MKNLNFNYLNFLLLILLNATFLKAQNTISNQIDALFETTNDEKNPGMAVMVVQNKKVFYSKGFGYANLEHAIPITPNTVFDLASLSKQFTGYAIATLIESGKLKEDDDIRKYIPELPDFGHTITINHLIHHTSGIRDWTSTLPLTGRSFDDLITFEQILRMVYAQKELNFKPGTEYSYTNTGYNLLAEVVKRVTGQSLKEWAHNNLFNPLGMKNTLFMDDHTEIINNKANSYYQKEDGKYYNSASNLTAVGSSSLFSSTNDLAKWVSFLDEQKTASDPVVVRMMQKGKLNNGEENSYAYGLSVSEFRNTPWISHSGSWASFSTYLVYLPEYSTSIIVLNNSDGSAYMSARKIAKIIVPEVKPVENTKTSSAKVSKKKKRVTKNRLDSFTGKYRLGPAWYVDITRKDNELWVQATGEDIFPMTFESKSLFSVEAYGGRTMTFVENESGEITHLKYAGMDCQKVAGNISLDSDIINTLIGEYKSEELNTTYSVIYDDNKLKLKHFSNGVLDMTQVWRDDFYVDRWFINSVEFYRDSNGNVQGFYVTNHRARNQMFEKIK